MSKDQIKQIKYKTNLLQKLSILKYTYVLLIDHSSTTCPSILIV